MKNRQKNKLFSLINLLLVVAFFSCDTQEKLEETYKSNKPKSKSVYDIEILKIRDCEYVLWHNGYGSDMEHYEGCENPKHY